MNKLIKREQDVHGTSWNTVHDGYFGDSAVAAPLVKTIRQVAAAARPDTIIDLGGGTGFLLSRVMTEGVRRGTSLVNLDDSPTQLRAARSRGITCLRGSVDAFSRRATGFERTRCLFVIRSVLHYFGRRGLSRVLRRLRAQTQPGEFFVHQTASFRRAQDAACLNDIYAMMHTRKWYPTVAALSTALRKRGWKVWGYPPLRRCD